MYMRAEYHGYNNIIYGFYNSILLGTSKTCKIGVSILLLHNLLRLRSDKSHEENIIANFS